MFVHGSASARPGTGGIVAELPLASTTARLACRTSVAHAHPPLAVETAVTAHEDDAALLEPRQLGGVVEVVDDLVASREHGVGVERARRDARHAPCLGGELSRPQERLRRHAGEERALAAHEPLLDDRDLEPGFSEPAGDHLAGRSGTDHHDVERALGHALTSVDCQRRVGAPDGGPHPRGVSCGRDDRRRLRRGMPSRRPSGRRCARGRAALRTLPRAGRQRRATSRPGGGGPPASRSRPHRRERCRRPRRSPHRQPRRQASRHVPSGIRATMPACRLRAARLAKLGREVDVPFLHVPDRLAAAIASR